VKKLVMPNLNLIVIRAENPDRTAKFYAALGLRFSKERHGQGPEHYACAMEAGVFEIYPLKAGDERTTGARIGFSVDSLEDVLSALGREERPKIIVGSGGADRRTVVRDPEGHKVELVELAA
jgi:lactoylglutathione lyase